MTNTNLIQEIKKDWSEQKGWSTYKQSAEWLEHKLNEVYASAKREVIDEVEKRVKKLPIVTFNAVQTASGETHAYDETVYLRDILSSLKDKSDTTS